MNIKFTNRILTIGFIIIPILLTDLILKISKYPSQNNFFMFLSGGEFNSQMLGIRTFKPNSLLRNVGLYGNEIEYDYKFKTDQYGFRSTHNCIEKKSNLLYAIAGDSFTEGQGSSIVWVTNLQKILCDRGVKSLNTAMSGYSIIGMNKSLGYAKKVLNAKRAIVAITSGDITRPHSEMMSSEECSFYVSRTNKCGDSATWWHLPPELNKQDIITFSKTKNNYGLKELYRILKIKIKQKFQYFKKRNPKNKNLRLNIEAMNNIELNYGAKNTTLIILPTKLESNLEKKPDKKKIFANNLNIFLNSIDKKIKVYDLRECPLKKRHFHNKDGHPNEFGHLLLGKCIENKFKFL